MESLLADVSRPPARMASLPCSPLGCETGRHLLDDGGCNDNLSNCSEDIPPLTAGRQIDLISLADTEDCISSKDEQDTSHSFSPMSQGSYVREDHTELGRVDAASPASEAGGEGTGDTIEDIMNIPSTTVVPVPVLDFSSLYPSDESVSEDAEQMRSHRERIQEKLRKQVLAQENESKVAALSESAELDTLQHSDGDEVNIFDGTGFLDDLHRAEMTSASFRARSLSSIELTSDTGIDLSFSMTPSRKSARSSRSSESKITSPFKRRRKASSPDELAELSRVAAIEEAEAEEEAALKELEKYREMDLAPLEPIMESKTAGDLIVHGTPMKAHDREIFGQESSIVHATPVKEQDTEIFGWNPRTPESRSLQVQSGQKRKRGAQLQLQTPPRCFISQNKKHDTHIKKSDVALPSPDEHQAAPHALHPPFIKVIEAIPATIFWCTAATITRCSMKAFDTLVERLTGLSVEDA